MKKEFVKLKCLSPEISLGNTTFNGNLLANKLLSLEGEGVDVVALPELCLCGTSLGDLLSNSVILNGAIKSLN